MGFPNTLNWVAIFDGALVYIIIIIIFFNPLLVGVGIPQLNIVQLQRYLKNLKELSKFEQNFIDLLLLKAHKNSK